MTTVLSVYNSRGCVGRCDANCHDAKSESCRCICQGRNHGKGFACAETNVREMIGLTTDDLVAFAQATKRDPKELVVVNRIKTPDMREALRQARTRLTQLDLFDREETII
jgi:hypothetical protein